MLKIMFVCLGNICRSAMAECVMKHLIKQRSLEDVFFIDSAGTSDEEEDNDIYPPAKRKLQKMGIELIPHKAKQLRAADYEKYDMFLCAEQRNVSSAIRIFGTDRDNKVMRMLDLSDNPRNIADPWWTGNFDEAYDDILDACESIIKYAKDKSLR